MPCPGEWRNWQTRRLQVPVSLRSWGFKSPLAHDVFPTTPPRRRGRRRTAIVLAVITIVALVFLAAGRQRSDTRDSIAYLVQADSTVTAYRDIGRQFQSQILEGLTFAQREDVQTLVDQYVDDAESESATLDGMRVPSSLASVAAPLELALSAWNRGLQTFTEGLFAVVDHPDDEASIEALSNSLTQLRVGDTAYLDFLDAVGQLDSNSDLPVDFPDVTFLPSSALGYYAGTSAAVDGADGLALRRDLEVSAVKLEPREVSMNDSGDLVLPATDSIVVEASIGNSGNQTEEDIRVSVTLQDAGGTVLYQQTLDVAKLEPRGSTTVDFDAVPVTPGGRFTIIVALTALPQDVDVANNVAQIHVRINDAS
jgi:hypothetical protein